MDKIEKMDKVKAVHDILDLEEIEEMIPIDEDLALKMKKEVRTFKYIIPSEILIHIFVELSRLSQTLCNAKSKTLDMSNYEFCLIKETNCLK